jgi:HlyD family secretion protein
VREGERVEKRSSTCPYGRCAQCRRWACARCRLLRKAADSTPGGMRSWQVGPLVGRPTTQLPHMRKLKHNALPNVRAYENALTQERRVLERARHDLAAAEEVRSKLLSGAATLSARRRSRSRKLARDGYAGSLLRSEKSERTDPKGNRIFGARSFLIAAARATNCAVGITACPDRGRLQTAAAGRAARRFAPQADRLREELAKHAHRPRVARIAGTAGGRRQRYLPPIHQALVVAAGTILMTLVPEREAAASARSGWPTTTRVFVLGGDSIPSSNSPRFPFQKYGMATGTVVQLSADANEAPTPNTQSSALRGARPVGRCARLSSVD